MGIGERREHVDEPPAERIHAIHRYDICPVCDGGSGWRTDRPDDAWFDGTPWRHTCPRCGGMGVARAVVAPEVGKETCSACGHTLPPGYVGTDGLCFLCRPLTDEQWERIR